MGSDWEGLLGHFRQLILHAVHVEIWHRVFSSIPDVCLGTFTLMIVWSMDRHGRDCRPGPMLLPSLLFRKAWMRRGIGSV